MRVSQHDVRNNETALLHELNAVKLTPLTHHHNHRDSSSPSSSSSSASTASSSVMTPMSFAVADHHFNEGEGMSSLEDDRSEGRPAISAVAVFQQQEELGLGLGGVGMEQAEAAHLHQQQQQQQQVENEDEEEEIEGAASVHIIHQYQVDSLGQM